MNTTTDNPILTEAAPDEDPTEPLIALASALMDVDRLRIAGKLAEGSANRMELAEATGLSHRELLRQLGLLQYFGLVKLSEPAPRTPTSTLLMNWRRRRFVLLGRQWASSKVASPAQPMPAK